jgi:hypothetical protein
VKKLILGAAVAAALVAPVALIPSMAGATGSSTGSAVSINQYADFNFVGTQLDVGLQVACTGNTGVVNVTAEQYPPETPIAAFGTGVVDVVCDGRTHNVGVTIVGAIFDAGKAKVTATLTAPSGNVTVSRQIVVRVV